MAESRIFYRAALTPFGIRVVKDLGDVAVGSGYRVYAMLAPIPEAGSIEIED